MFYKRNNYQDIYKNLHRLSRQIYPKEPNEIAPGILRIILADIRLKKEFEIEGGKVFWQKFARVSCNFQEGLSYLELRKKGSKFEVRMDFCGNSEVYYKSRLTREHEELIPKELKRLLNTVKDLEGKIKFNTDLIDGN